MAIGNQLPRSVGRNNVLNFHIDWFDSIRISLTMCAIGNRQTDRQTTDIAIT